MQLFLSLKRYLQESKAVRSNKQVDGYISSGEFAPTVKRDEKGLLVAEFEYTCMIFIEQYKEDARYLIALISLWIKDNTDSEERKSLEAPNLEIDPDGNGVDVVLSLRFCERVRLTEDPSGALEHDGKLYGFGAASVNTAETANVIAQY